MSALDLVVAAVTAMAVVGGFRIGFVARAASWVGLVAGFSLTLRAVPSVLSWLRLPTASGRLALAVGVLVVGSLAGQAAGLVLGHRMRGILPAGGARTADRVVGATAGGLAVVIGLWLVVPALVDTPGWPSRAARRSLAVRALGAALPEPPDATRTVRRLVAERGFPRVFDAGGRAPDAGVPPVSSGIAADVEERVVRSTVQVVGEGAGCRRFQEGSGFVVDHDVVVTNAHVVAGVDEVEVVRPDGRRLPAAVAVFDPGRDLAVLRTDRLGLEPLPRAGADVGDRGAVYGHPGGQVEVRGAPARISGQVPAQGRDIYDRGRIVREVFVLSTYLSPGDSGGALVDRQGRVVGVAFAIAPDRPGTAYALTNAELDAALRSYRARPEAKADTRTCIP